MLDEPNRHRGAGTHEFGGKFMGILILGIVIFLGIHSVRIVAPRWREQRIAAMGKGAWKGVYSLASAVGLALIVWGFYLARQNTYDYYAPPQWLVSVAMGLMALAFMSMMVGNLKPGRLKPALKHPLLLAVKAWALAHLLVNADLASFVLFGSFLGWAVWDRIDEKWRGTPPPPAGPVSNDIIAVVSGLAIWALFVWKLHEWLFGVPVIV